MGTNLKLHVGGDDSNHGNEVGGEIIVATYSVRPEDGEIIKRAGEVHRDFRGALEYLSQEGRDWNFTVRFGERYKRRGQNIPFILPELINDYLGRYGWAFSEVSAYIDGAVKPHAKVTFLDKLQHVPNFSGEMDCSVAAFPKKKRKVREGIVKDYKCPELIWMADSVANGLYRNFSMGALVDHERFVVPFGAC